MRKYKKKKFPKTNRIDKKGIRNRCSRHKKLLLMEKQINDKVTVKWKSHPFNFSNNMVSYNVFYSMVGPGGTKHGIPDSKNPIEVKSLQELVSKIQLTTVMFGVEIEIIGLHIEKVEWTLT